MESTSQMFHRHRDIWGPVYHNSLYYRCLRIAIPEDRGSDHLQYRVGQSDNQTAVRVPSQNRVNCSSDSFNSMQSSGAGARFGDLPTPPPLAATQHSAAVAAAGAGGAVQSQSQPQSQPHQSGATAILQPTSVTLGTFSWTMFIHRFHCVLWCRCPPERTP
jgi:hypothetical protein